ncbi:PD-(D/E)XK nuclease family protein [Flavobacterium wongokense]|uniref:PD-(D/E)XK nuclease family protein n=1 Tax=Flavobacterium wongokense TaxID=2910674 RepID=UPI001F266107|nr:PD-(D/E)XK nuclease family protein [Flavobacterium sp. WG47]MCF6131321.1 PD-(D/E)XK nuclease family protein [Flavobacterium sp. WG47]
MSKPTFLHLLAQEILKSHSDNLSGLTIVLPNKRAKVFLLDELRKLISNNVIAPEIISIEEFVQDVAGIRSIDSVELLFEFYEVYLSLTNEKPESFENFANWAKTLLQDFNEIDRYLLDPNAILKYLENIKEIEHWSVDIDKRTELIEKHLLFWKKLPDYYHSLYQYLRNKGVGYQGLIYREAVENLDHFSENNDNRQFIFAGFNALNQAEEKIIQHLLALENAKIYWDIDETLLYDSFHDAGLFQRRFKSEWIYYKSHPYEWIVNDFKKEKNIQVIATSKSIGQAKIAGSIIKKHTEENNSNLQNVALVLGEENLLLPVLHSLPDSVDALNITMGFSSKNNPAQLLIAKLFKLHNNALTRNASSYVMYYKDVLDILTHPLIEPFVFANELVNRINKNNFTFIPHKKLEELHPESNELFKLLFQKWDLGSVAVLENISQILLRIKANLSYENEEEKITNAFVYSIFKVINKMISYFSEHPQIDDIKTLQAIYKQVIDVAEVSFEGEPLNGLQLMGVLESRVLDFETVIITSVNEGKFPAGKSTNSFIPYDVKKEYGLPTFKEKDAIYTYHFYHLLQRAKDIYLIYNSDSEGFDAGEKSRFITQLEVEKQPNHNLTFQYYNPDVPNIAHQPIVIPKTESILERLREIAEKGFSPSSLTTYIRNPIQFYFQRVLRISETDEVEENIAVNTLGTIIHGALEELYKPFIGRLLTTEDIKRSFAKIDAEVLSQFKLVYKEGEIQKGKNLLAFEVAKRNVLNFLKLELESLENGDEIQIIDLEAELFHTLNHPDLPFPVKIGGKVDRIEFRARKGEKSKIRIVDYKTGKVEQRNVTLKEWNGLTEDIKNEKIIQVLAYAFMYENLANGQEIEAGIISFKNLKSGFLPFQFKPEKEPETIISPEIMENYLEQLVILLQEILDVNIPFEEKVT